MERMGFRVWGVQKGVTVYELGLRFRVYGRGI